MTDPDKPSGEETPESRTPNALPTGARVGDFEVTGIVGEGGFSFVYRAFDHTLHRTVALKEYMPNALARRREDGGVTLRASQYASTFEAGRKSFVNEARLLAQFDHPALVKVFRFWEQNDTAYMVMPLYEGRTLKAMLRESAQPDEAWLKAILAPLLDALETLHGAKCYHRDIAPDNILMLDSGGPLLLDFGAARRIIGDMTQAVTVIIKPGYAPVEQYADDPAFTQGPWTDIYALSAVVRLAITGKPPATSVTRMVTDPVRPLAESVTGYSKEFLEAIDRGLAVRPEDRPQSVAEFRQLLGIRTIAPSMQKLVLASQPSVLARAQATQAIKAIPAPPAPAAREAAQGDADGTIPAGSEYDGTVPAPRPRDSAPPGPAGSVPPASVPADLSITKAMPDPSRPAPVTAAPVAATQIRTPMATTQIRGASGNTMLGSSSASSSPRGPAARKTWIAAGVIVAVLAVIIVGGYFVMQSFAPVGKKATGPIVVTTPSPPPAARPPEPPAASTPASVPPAAAQAPVAAPSPTPAPAAASNPPPDGAPSFAPPAPAPESAPVAMPAPAVNPATAAQPVPPPAAAAPPTGRVALDIKPWGEVMVDGHARGLSPPLKNLSLPEGKHRIEIRNPVAAAVVRDVDVKAGRSESISLTFK